jgi:16S rRNA (cytosine1402-N4)-methyltransferase
MYHTPVLLKDCIEGLNIKPGGIYIDVTYGGGGHSREIIKHLEQGKLFAFDQDEDAKANAIQDERFTLVPENFRYLKNFLRLHNVTAVDGILADLGVSSHQFDSEQRGFSTRFDGELDMRMTNRNELTAKKIVNEYDKETLKKILKEFGEVESAGKIAALICESRKDKKINTAEQLKEIIKKCSPRAKENQFYAKVFQALRIEVNGELEALIELLKQSMQMLKPEGRLVVISYHSLEDRLVKNFMRSGNIEGEIEKDFFGNELVPFKVITRKAIVPDEKEIENNSRARSAKLRIAEKLEQA